MVTKIPLLLRLFGCSSTLLVALYLFMLSTAQAQTLDHDAPEGWLPFATLTQGLADPGVATVGSTLHIVGGLSPEGPADLHLRMEADATGWQKLPALPVPRSDATTATVGERLYIFGGYNVWYGGAVSYTHAFESTSQRWITATAMITPVSGAAAVVIDDDIYVFGGFDNHSESAFVQQYNPEQDRWSIQRPMPEARSEFAAVLLDEKVYLIGGNIRSMSAGDPAATRATSLSSTLVSVYDVATDSWQRAAPLPAPRVDAAAIVRNGKIYVTGGTDQWLSGNVLADLFVYDPTTDQWSSGPPLLRPRGGHRAALVQERLYLIGGYDTNSAPLASVNRLDMIASTIYLPTVRKD